MKYILMVMPSALKTTLNLLAFLLMAPALFAADQEQTTETAQAQPTEEKLLVKHVLLFDQDGLVEDELVNILIIDRKLQIVTKDEISEEGIGETIDTQGGILLGKLEIGASVSFMVLDQDPREDIKILIDTKKYTYLAIVNGEIVLNRYGDVIASDASQQIEKPAKKSGWIAYAPPPVSLPLTYKKGERAWNAWSNEYFNGSLHSILFVDRQAWMSQNSASKQQLNEDLNDYNGGEIRGFRIGVVGQLKFDNPWVYTIFGEMNAFDKGFDAISDDKINWLDWRLDVPISKHSALSIGKQKEPISMERIMSLADLPMMERTAVSDALLRSRNVGIVLNGNWLNQRMTLAGGLFNDWFTSGQKFNDSTSQVVGRFTCLPLIDQSENTLLHLGFGLRYSNTKEGVQYSTEPEFDQAPVFVDTGLLAADNTMTYNLETSFRTGPFWLAGEYTRTNVSSTLLNDPKFDGYHITLSWIMSGEIRPYNKTSGIMGKIHVAQDVYSGGWGTWESAVRWSTLDANDGLISGGEMDILSLGLNWYLTDNFRLHVDYRHVELDDGGLIGTSDGITARVALYL